uniref:Uncharacterized protein n=1 Tax=Sinocyclocheilus grahami TaxID=75366 RepID=A0A672LGK4_SINGR
MYKKCVCVLCQLKQMKELEQEKDSLLASLDVLERSREWHQMQIHNITETQRHIGQSCHSTSQLEVVLPKLQDVTRCLCDLLSFSGKTFPSTGSSSAPPAPAPPQAIHILKEQNRSDVLQCDCSLNSHIDSVVLF